MNIEKILEMLSGTQQMDYRERMERRHPEMKENVLQDALSIMEKYKTLSTDDLTEYIRLEFPHPVIDGLQGLLIALENLSQGQMGSRPKGPTPANVIVAFSHWLFQNPEIEQQFRGSDIFQELCDSGYSDFEWPDKYDENDVPNPMVFGGNDEPTPGNYL